MLYKFYWVLVYCRTVGMLHLNVLLSLTFSFYILHYISYEQPYGYLISIWTREAISRDSIQVGVHWVSPWWTWVWGCLISGALGAACICLIIRVRQPSNGTGERDGGHLCCQELFLLSGIKLGIWSLPHVEPCSLPTLTSREVTWVLLAWGWSGEPLVRVVPLLLGGGGWEERRGMPH